MHLHTDVRLHSFRPALLSKTRRRGPLLARTAPKPPEGALPAAALPAPHRARPLGRGQPGAGTPIHAVPLPRRQRAGSGQGHCPVRAPPRGSGPWWGGGRLPPGGLHPCPGVTARSATLPHSVRVRKVRWHPLCRPVPPSLCPAATRRARRMVGPCP